MNDAAQPDAEGPHWPDGSKPIAIGNPPLVAGRTAPHSVEAEVCVLSCCLLDGNDTIARCLEAKLHPAAFYSAANRLVYEKLVELYNKGISIELSVLAEELNASKQLDEIGGYSFLVQISGRVPTTAQAGFFIGRLRELHARRELIKIAGAIAESCFSSQESDIGELLEGVRKRIDDVDTKTSTKVEPRSIASFSVLPDGAESVLLGNGYLNRGDGAVFVGSSGMGKSSFSLQASCCLALGKPVFGIKPSKPLRILIVQSEDGDGDIGEVWESVRYGLKLTTEEQALVADRVKIVTERTLRGEAFIHVLRKWIREHKPDIVWINPLLAFMDGNLNEAHDAGKFLREGLNGLNEPPQFAFIIVHHTTKPPTGRDRAERRWNEIMYDMAGSADLTNWARAVLSLRATETEGEFNLVLAKRGRRAGVVKEVAQGAATRLEITTTIPLRHARGTIQMPGRAKPLPLIFWEARPEDTAEASPTVSKGGRPKEHTFGALAELFPTDPKQGLGFSALHRAANEVRPIARSTLADLIEEALSLSLIARDMSDPTRPRYYRVTQNNHESEA